MPGVETPLRPGLLPMAGRPLSRLLQGWLCAGATFLPQAGPRLFLLTGECQGLLLPSRPEKGQVWLSEPFALGWAGGLVRLAHGCTQADRTSGAWARSRRGGPESC